MQFALWLWRYISTGLLFFIGLKAPGLPRRPYMLLINEDERDIENGRQVDKRFVPAVMSYFWFCKNMLPIRAL